MYVQAYKQQIGINRVLQISDELSVYTGAVSTIPGLSNVLDKKEQNSLC